MIVIPRIEAKNIDKKADVLKFFESCELAFWRDYEATKENLEVAFKKLEKLGANPYSIHLHNFHICRKTESALLEEMRCLKL